MTMFSKIDKDEHLWCQKYRPATVDECVLPVKLKKIFNEMKRLDEIPNMILVGAAGTGKTTVARALCNDLYRDVLFINASEESGIDVLRNKIKTFASTVSLINKHKVVILDEADYLNPQSTQPALRAFIEEFSKHCRFIMTCNFSHRLIEPLHSRSVVVDFAIPKAEKPKMATQIFARLSAMLDEEGVESNEKVLQKLVITHFPDYRKMINELQRHCVDGVLDPSILTETSDDVYTDLIENLKDRNFKAIRKWVVDVSIDDNVVFKNLYDILEKHVKPDSLPAASVLIAEYMYKSAFVTDKEINLVACLASLMVEMTWR